MKSILLLVACFCVAAAPPVPVSTSTSVRTKTAYHAKVVRLRTAKTPRMGVSLNQPMVMVSATPKTVIIAPVQPRAEASWSRVSGADGYVLNWGLADLTNYPWRSDAGTATNVTVYLPGGFTNQFTVQSYWAKRQTNGSRVVMVKTYSSPSLPVSFVPVLPLNSPQLLLPGDGQWHVMAQSATGGHVQASQDLRTWHDVGVLPVNQPAGFMGLTLAQEYFRLTTN